MSNNDMTLANLLRPDGPACLIIKATFEPLGDQDRFQPAGFPEMGHVIYDAPQVEKDKDGKVIRQFTEKVCIVDSAASMANHLETLCFANPTAGILHSDLDGLPYVRCVTDGKSSTEGNDRRMVVSTLTEGHRLASDYFLDATLNERNFRKILREAFGITEIKKDQTYFVTPDDWWTIYTTIFQYDPNSLVHGILFAKEQIKISRLLTAQLEAFGAARVGSSGVKFDRLGKTNSGQPIFSKDEETAHRIEATFLIDLGLLRSYGHEDNGLSAAQKNLLLHLSLWKVERMLSSPFRFRSGCHLQCVSRSFATETTTNLPEENFRSSIASAIDDCEFGEQVVTDVYYAAAKLFQAQGSVDASEPSAQVEPSEEEGDEPEN